MLSVVREQRPSYNNDRSLACSPWKSRLKLMYVYTISSSQVGGVVERKKRWVVCLLRCSHKGNVNRHVGPCVALLVSTAV